MKIQTTLILSFITMCSHGAEPADLKKLRQARSAHIEKIDAQYTQALERLKLRFTKAGRLEDAMLVVAEMAKYSKDTEQTKIEEPKKDEQKEEFFKKVVAQKWQWRHVNDTTSWVILNPNKSVKLNWIDDKRIGWKYLGERKAQIDFPQGALVTLTWDKNYSSYKGTDFNRTTGVTLAMWGKLIK